MILTMLGKVRRADGVWYIALTRENRPVEFQLMADTSPAVVGKLNRALPTDADEVELDTNDIKVFHRAVSS